MSWTTTSTLCRDCCEREATHTDASGEHPTCERCAAWWIAYNVAEHECATHTLERTIRDLRDRDITDEQIRALVENLLAGGTYEGAAWGEILGVPSIADGLEAMGYKPIAAEEA